MEKVRVTHPLFLKISSEHRQIEDKLSEKKIATTGLTQLVQWLWDFVELSHHKKEEHILFNFIKNNPRICEGGPLCTLYFDFHMNNSPLEKAKKITGQTPVAEPHHMMLVSESSPLRIPISEHQAGKEILRHCKENMNGLQRSEILDLLTEYEKIQIEHMNKEEHCFFHLCTNLLKQEDADQLYLRWISE